MMKNKNKVRILLVEDDPNLNSVLKDYLDVLGYEAVVARDGEEGLLAFRSRRIDLCILDVMMPKKDGLTLAREIREKDAEVPIIFLTAKGLKEDRIEGFRAGCDDYITKPFISEELNLRIEAILRRCAVRHGRQPMTQDETFNVGQYIFDPYNMILTIKGSDKKLTRKEAALLRLLCLNKNKLLTREDALMSVWGTDDYFIGRSMDVFITKLRKHLKDDSNITITNVHGSGFKLEIRE